MSTTDRVSNNWSTAPPILYTYGKLVGHALAKSQETRINYIDRRTAGPTRRDPITEARLILRGSNSGTSPKQSAWFVWSVSINFLAWGLPQILTPHPKITHSSFPHLNELRQPLTSAHRTQLALFSFFCSWPVPTGFYCFLPPGTLDLFLLGTHVTALDKHTLNNSWKKLTPSPSHNSAQIFTKCVECLFMKNKPGWFFARVKNATRGIPCAWDFSNIYMYAEEKNNRCRFVYCFGVGPTDYFRASNV